MQRFKIRKCSEEVPGTQQGADCDQHKSQEQVCAAARQLHEKLESVQPAE